MAFAPKSNPLPGNFTSRLLCNNLPLGYAAIDDVGGFLYLPVSNPAYASFCLVIINFIRSPPKVLSINLFTLREVSSFDGVQDILGYSTSVLSPDGRTLYLSSRQPGGTASTLIKLSLPRMCCITGNTISNIVSPMPLGLFWQRNMQLYPM